MVVVVVVLEVLGQMVAHPPRKLAVQARQGTPIPETAAQAQPLRAVVVQLMVAVVRVADATMQQTVLEVPVRPDT